MAGVKIHANGHDVAQAELTLALALTLAAVQQALRIEGLKHLAKVVHITEHSDELAHRDPHMVQAAFSDTATIRWSL